MADRGAKKIRRELEQQKALTAQERTVTEQKNKKLNEVTQRSLARTIRAKLGGGYIRSQEKEAKNSTLG